MSTHTQHLIDSATQEMKYILVLSLTLLLLISESRAQFGMDNMPGISQMQGMMSKFRDIMKTARERMASIPGMNMIQSMIGQQGSSDDSSNSGSNSLNGLFSMG